MKNFLATTATALILGTSAFADGHTSAFADMTFDVATNLNASNIIGMRVYASEADIENDMMVAGDETEWDDIGEINEIILTRDGDVQSVIVGVGGFLGMGEKDVAINMDQLQFVTENADSEDFFLVVKATAVGVQDAPAYEYSQITNTMDDDSGALADDTMETADPAIEDMTTDGRMALTRPTTEREGYLAIMADQLTAEELTGANVYGANDEDIGEISELLLTDDGEIDRAIIDVGGFLGLGEYPVAVTMDELQIMREDGGEELRVYIDSTQEALEAQPEYEG